MKKVKIDIVVLPVEIWCEIIEFLGDVEDVVCFLRVLPLYTLTNTYFDHVMKMVWYYKDDADISIVTKYAARYLHLDNYSCVNFESFLSLEHVTLEGTYIDANGLNYLGSRISSLNIMYNTIDEYFVNSLKNAITMHNNITSVSFRRCVFKDGKRISMDFAVIAANVTSLFLKSSVTPSDIIVGICTGIAVSGSKLTSLTLDYVTIETEVLGCLAIALKGNSVREISLMGNNIDDYRLEILRPAFTDPNTKIAVLDLGGNVFGYECIVTLSNILTNEHNKITKFSLRKCHLDEHLMRIICETLVHPNCKVTHLDMSNTFFGRHTTHIKKILCGHKIKVLDLRNNDIRYVINIITNMDQCTLERLNVSYCSAEFLSVIRGKYKLQCLGMENANITKFDTAIRKLRKDMTILTTKYECKNEFRVIKCPHKIDVYYRDKRSWTKKVNGDFYSDVSILDVGISNSYIPS